MRFYGIPSEDRAFEIVKRIEGGEWVFEDIKEGSRALLGPEEVKAKLEELLKEVTSWRESLAIMLRGTVFVFVHEPSQPKAFKIYDPSSLGCSTELTPPRWKVYIRELDGEV
ncbi:MAG TPA: hypothetical protein EYP11_06375 [Aquificaceae bacterium]|nr:hypothetical protein [Aquificaceae bacterium]HIQ31337.1 hypothetical protein [Aquifex aeolicus]